jgi:N-acetyl sugar amidotransferase
MKKDFYFCKQCLTTSLRPNAAFTNGVCNPCLFVNNEEEVDFDDRLKKLKTNIERVMSRHDRLAEHDCIVGVSGGKDSTRQALWVRDKLGLNPLLVCCAYPPKQMLDLGAKNLENLINLGFDLEVYNPAPETAAQLSKTALVKFGNVCKASEIALFTTVPQIAIERNIKMCFFGENPALQEGDSATLGEDEFDANQLRGLNTLTSGGVSWIWEVAGDSNFHTYQYPSEEEFLERDINMFYLGPAWSDWDMEENALFSMLEGLKTRPNEEHITGDLTNASMLDEEFTNINMMIKYYKFGFGRASDLCNELIRAGKITREEAIDIVTEYDGICNDAIVDSYCRWVDMSLSEFWGLVWSYTNKDLFDKTDGRPVRKFDVGKPICV